MFEVPPIDKPVMSTPTPTNCSTTVSDVSDKPVFGVEVLQHHCLFIFIPGGNSVQVILSR